jgi:hypothetical protein
MKTAKKKAFSRYTLIESLGKTRTEMMELRTSELNKLIGEARHLEFTFGIAAALMQSLIDERRLRKSERVSLETPQDS